jgi:hypothetical protein
MYFAQRPAGDHPEEGWQTESIFPPRDQLVGSLWFGPVASEDLSSIYARNGGGVEVPTTRFFRLTPGAPSTLLHDGPALGFLFAASADGSRVVAVLKGSPDPEHPVAGSQLYDLSSGAPHLIGFLPDGSVPACNVGILTSGQTAPLAASHVVSPDGNLAFFGCNGTVYARDFLAAQTIQISQSGCNASFLKSTPGAAFYWCDASGGNVYRYDFGDGARDCVTCVVPGLDAEVHLDIASDNDASSGPSQIAVAPDGSRVYFNSPQRLLPGAAPGGLYRVEVTSGDLAYVANGAVAGEAALNTEAISSDGSVIIFGSRDPSLNPLGGTASNGGTFQYYRYDDDDRSLTCVSCPQDGRAPKRDLEQRLLGISASDQTAPGATPLAGETFAFATSEPLVGADQNTPKTGNNPLAGTDVYEWRDGRLLLVTDGLTQWPAGSEPKISGVSGGGRDLYFTASAQYTLDAPDSYYRLYDARIGGGIAFPPEEPPCPLEVCQGTPKGAPEEAAPGSSTFVGPGNPAAGHRPRPCPKGKVRRKGRCVEKHHRKHKPGHRRADHHRRSAR